MDPNKSKPLKTAKTSWQESVQQVNTLLVPVKEAVVIFRQNPEYDIVAGGSHAFSQENRKKMPGRFPHTH